MPAVLVDVIDGLSVPEPEFAIDPPTFRFDDPSTAEKVTKGSFHIILRGCVALAKDLPCSTEYVLTFAVSADKKC